MVALAILMPNLVWAAPANPKVWTFTQPDNTTFQAVLVGDEFYAYHKTVEGDIIVQDPSSGYWHHAIPRSDGSLGISSRVVGRDVTARVPVPAAAQDIAPMDAGGN